MCEELEVDHTGCAGHTLNLSCQDGLKDEAVEDLLIKCRELCTHIKTSNKVEHVSCAAGG